MVSDGLLLALLLNSELYFNWSKVRRLETKKFLNNAFSYNLRFGYIDFDWDLLWDAFF